MDYQHRQSAHCESGVVSNLLTHHGLPLSEPMAFGLANALTFAYIPLVKLSGMPLIAYRMPPGRIIKGVAQRLGVTMQRATYRDAGRGMRELDALLDSGQIAGLQTSVFWLPYFPEQMRFHFNAHNLIVYGRDGDDYLISDPVFETTARCAATDLRKARFARGALAARGLLYRPTRVPTDVDLRPAIRAALKANHRIMNQAPLPVIGIRGIRHLAKCIVRLGRPGADREHLNLYLAHIVRMQEEIGTGGAGFRFIYASFLQEAAKLCDSDLLKQAALDLTEAGDEWRLFALRASKMARGRSALDVDELAAILNRCADREAAVWGLLKGFV